MLSAGAVLTGLSWALAAGATTTGLYLTYGVLGGIGTGIIYVGAVCHVAQWFPDRRGLATGLVAADYGFGAILTTFPISQVIRTSDYHGAQLDFGVIFGAVGLISAQGLRRPEVRQKSSITVINEAATILPTDEEVRKLMLMFSELDSRTRKSIQTTLTFFRFHKGRSMSSSPK